MDSVFKYNLTCSIIVYMSLPVYHENSQQTLQMQIKEYAKIMPKCNLKKKTIFGGGS